MRWLDRRQFASLTLNRDGDLVMGFSGSSSQSYVSAHCHWRKADGSSPATPRLIREGDDPFGVTGLDVVRLGNYSFTTLDPSDGLTVWTVQEYAEEFVEPDPVWGTWIYMVPSTP